MRQIILAFLLTGCSLDIPDYDIPHDHGYQYHCHTTGGECAEGSVTPGYDFSLCSDDEDAASDEYRAMVLDVFQKTCSKYWFSISCDMIGDPQDNICFKD